MVRRAMRWAAMNGSNWLSYQLVDFTGVRVIGRIVIKTLPVNTSSHDVRAMLDTSQTDVLDQV